MKAVIKPKYVDFIIMGDIKSIDEIINWVESFGENFNDCFRIEKKVFAMSLYIKIPDIEDEIRIDSDVDVIIRWSKNDYSLIDKEELFRAFTIVSDGNYVDKRIMAMNEIRNYTSKDVVFVNDYIDFGRDAFISGKFCDFREEDNTVKAVLKI